MSASGPLEVCKVWAEHEPDLTRSPPVRVRGQGCRLGSSGAWGGPLLCRFMAGSHCSISQNGGSRGQGTRRHIAGMQALSGQRDMASTVEGDRKAEDSSLGGSGEDNSPLAWG